MEKLKIKSELISLEKQVEVLEKAKSKLHVGGLCNDIDKALLDLVEDKLPKKNMFRQSPDKYVSMYIPLFKFENAKAFGGAKDIGGFWWEYKPYDFDSRLIFLNWMIEQIKTEIEND